MFSKIKAIFKKPVEKNTGYSNTTNKALSIIYTSKSGDKFYTYNDQENLPPIRGIQFSKFQRIAELNIDHETFNTVLTEFKKAVNKQDYYTAIALIYELDRRQSLLCEENSLLDMICCFCFLEDENPYSFEAHHYTKKKQIFNTDTDARAFFLTVSFPLLMKLKEKLPTDLINYLMNPMVQKEAEKLNLMLKDLKN